MAGHITEHTLDQLSGYPIYRRYIRTETLCYSRLLLGDLSKKRHCINEDYIWRTYIYMYVCMYIHKRKIVIQILIEFFNVH